MLELVTSEESLPSHSSMRREATGKKQVGSLADLAKRQQNKKWFWEYTETFYLLTQASEKILCSPLLDISISLSRELSSKNILNLIIYTALKY